MQGIIDLADRIERELIELAAEAMVRAYIEDVFNRISIALGSKLKRRLASGR
jgi:hypothetical protein